MVFAKPHYLLFCDAHVWDNTASDAEPAGGRWHFVLERIDIAERLEASDGERGQPRDRLSLWSVVRGLEAIEQPSQVTLVTTSRYVSRGLRYGLSEWREDNYIWEHFGVQKPIRNADLWQRIDSAMQYHEVTCRLLESSLTRVDPAHAAVTEPDELSVVDPSSSGLLPGPISEPGELNPTIPAPHFRPRAPQLQSPAPRLRRAASVRHKPRPGSVPETATWKQLAGGLLDWCRGRTGWKAATTSPRSSMFAGM